MMVSVRGQRTNADVCNAGSWTAAYMQTRPTLDCSTMWLYHIRGLLCWCSLILQLCCHWSRVRAMTGCMPA